MVNENQFTWHCLPRLAPSIEWLADDPDELATAAVVHDHTVIVEIGDVEQPSVVAETHGIVQSLRSASDAAKIRSNFIKDQHTIPISITYEKVSTVNIDANTTSISKL